MVIGASLTLLFAARHAPAQTPAGSAEASAQFQPVRDAARAPAALRVPVTLSLANVPLQDAVRAIADRALLGVSFRADLPNLNRRVSLQAAAMPAIEALLRVLHDTGLEMLVTSNGRTIVLQARPALPHGIECVIGGDVRDPASGAALPGVNVRVSNGLRTMTGADGRFCLSRVVAGAYSVEAAVPGRAPARVDSVMVPGEPAQQLTLIMAPVPFRLSDVVVTPGYFGIAHEAIDKKETLNREQIETLPQFGEDIYRAVNRLPGISSNDMSAKFTVRGGDATTVRVTLDGLELYEPFHLKDFDGALSILDVAAIGGVDLTTGGLPVEYGNHLTGAFDLHTTNQLYARPRTTVGLSISNVRIMSQGSFAHGNGMWLLSGRRGYLDIILRLAGQGDNLNPRYYDALGKVIYQLSPKNRVEVHALRAGDDALLVDNDDVGTIRSRYGSTYGWVTWHTTPVQRLEVSTQLSVGRLDWRRVAEEHGTGNDYDVREVRTFDVGGVKQDWRVSMSDRLSIKWGLEAKRGAADYDYFNRVGRSRVEARQGVFYVDSTRTMLSPDGSELGAYVAPRFRPWSPLTLEAGVRWDRQTHTDQAELSPRVNAALALDKHTTLRAAWGQYAQPQGLYELNVQDGQRAFSPADRATQVVAGIERDVGDGVTARVEAYRRTESDLRTRFRNVASRVEPIGEAEPDRTRLDLDRGRAQGVELFLQRHLAKSSWSASYALAHAVDFLHDGRQLDRPLDQRHTLYFDYTVAPSPDWHFSWSWQYHSGWPATEVSFRVDTLTTGDVWVTRSFSAAYESRLPAYHRMDLRLTRSFPVRQGRLSAFLDVFNLYNRKNPLAYAYNVSINRGRLFVQRAVEPMLPILPTIGAMWEF